MVPDDIEREARELEHSARGSMRCAAHSLDEVLRFKTLAEERAREASADLGASAGQLFRAAELRYDARGGMTAATERRRFEPGARWTLHGEEHVLEQADDSGREPRSSEESCGRWESTGDMTRFNGWLFLGLSDQGGYR